MPNVGGLMDQPWTWVRLFKTVSQAYAEKRAKDSNKKAK